MKGPYLNTGIIAIFVLIIAVIFFDKGCSEVDKTIQNEIKNMSANGSFVPCIDVEGRVLGDIISGSKIFLYETPGLNYSVVMASITEGEPIKDSFVNESREFAFSCLSYGKYVFVIPTASYTSSVGFPLPYEFDCQNFSLSISFQGGNSEFAVGAFSIEKSSSKNTSKCTDVPLLCRALKGPLYKDCSLT